jgi:hypothetical protein
MAQNQQGDDQAECAVGPALTVSDRPENHPERERRQRGNEQFAVMSRAHLGGDDARQLVRDAGRNRRGPAQPEGARKAVREPTGEHEMNGHSPGDRQIHRHDPAEPGRRVEYVSVHGCDVRQPTKEIRVPLRNAARRLELLGAEQPEGVAGNEHIRPHAAKQDLAGQQRPQQGERRQDADQCSGSPGPAWLPRHRVRRHAGVSGEEGGTGRPRPVR